jgi:hypothetical protein
VAVVRQPVDVALSAAGYRRLLLRLASALNARYPPWGKSQAGGGLALGMTAVVLTPEPIAPGDDAVLREVVNGRPLPRHRAVPMGVIRVNLSQEAISFALASGPEGVFTEAAAIADALTPHFRRYVLLIEE